MATAADQKSIRRISQVPREIEFRLEPLPLLPHSMLNRFPELKQWHDRVTETSGKNEQTLREALSRIAVGTGSSSSVTTSPAPAPVLQNHAARHAVAGVDPVHIAESQVIGLVEDLALKAPLSSPALTGIPKAPTASAGTSTTQLATTAFVTNALGVGIGDSIVNSLLLMGG